MRVNYVMLAMIKQYLNHVYTDPGQNWRHSIFMGIHILKEAFPINTFSGVILESIQLASLYIIIRRFIGNVSSQ